MKSKLSMFGHVVTCSLNVSRPVFAPRHSDGHVVRAKTIFRLKTKERRMFANDFMVVLVDPHMDNIPPNSRHAPRISY